MSSLRHIATEPANLNQKLTTSASCDHDGIAVRDRSPSSDSDVSVSTTSVSQASLQSEPPPQMISPLALALSSAVNGPNMGEYQENDKLENKKLALSRKRQTRRGSEWEILEGLKEGQRCEEKPEKFEGYMMKRRKWPLKGWHKRYFCCDKGILTYSKSSTEMARGKIHGTVDIGLSVISSKPHHRRIDIDAEEFIYHLKVKNNLLFHQWVAQLRHHRLYRQNEIAFGTSEAPKITTPVEETPTGVFSVPCTPTPVSRHGSRVRSPIGQSRVAAWILDSSAIDQGNKEISTLQDKLFQLNTILQHLEASASVCSSNHLELPEIDTVVLKKQRRRFLLRRKKSSKNSSCQQQMTSVKAGGGNKKPNKKKVEIVVLRDTGISSSTENISDAAVKSQNADTKKMPTALSIKDSAHLSSSHPSLTGSEDFARPHSLPDSASLLNCALTESVSSSSQNSLHRKYQEEFLYLAKEVHSGLRSMLRSLHTERERLKQILENECLPSSGSHTALIATIKNSLNQALMQNNDLRMRLQQIHATSDVGSTMYGAASPTHDDDEPTLTHPPVKQTLSHESSSVLSASEYFDAEENLSSSTSSSEASLSDDGGSFLSDVSEEGTEYTPIPSVSDLVLSPTRHTGRRSKLPVPKPDVGDFSLWNLLRKNIGKDLSKVSMPVTLNEPLNVLQRLCEELEYSELLDKAADCDDPYERIVYVAAFAVSAYSASYYRAGHKPFNPLLGETYECIREDKGFRFIAEQVSHHPPVSACYAESKNFIFWQDMRVKTKFWGKSMEILPIGSIHVLLPRTDDEYNWNKVTTCVHNLLSGQRWVDQYGEMLITDKAGDVCCKLNFVKASYWSNKRHEVYGTVTTREGEVVHNLFGKWTEALYCGCAPTAKCIWRPGAMPQDYELYYGFTTLAIELNELDPETSKLLPPTDSRLRPDQRLLEEGNAQMAESIKTQLELNQRERRKKREEEGVEYTPMWFKKGVHEGKDMWIYTHSYWETRMLPGFVNITFPVKIW